MLKISHLIGRISNMLKFIQNVGQGQEVPPLLNYTPPKLNDCILYSCTAITLTKSIHKQIYIHYKHLPGISHPVIKYFHMLSFLVSLPPSSASLQLLFVFLDSSRVALHDSQITIILPYTQFIL